MYETWHIGKLLYVKSFKRLICYDNFAMEGEQRYIRSFLGLFIVCFFLENYLLSPGQRHVQAVYQE